VPLPIRNVQWEHRDAPLNVRTLSRNVNDRRHRHGILVSAVAIVALAAVVSTQNAPPTPSLTVLTRDGHRLLPIAVAGDQELISLDDLAGAFQLAVQESLGAITVSYKGKTIVLTPDQSLASVAGRLISLPSAPTRSGRRWMVPVEFVSRALAPIYDVRLDLRKPSRLLIVGDLRVPRITFRSESLGASLRLTIDSAPRANSTVSQENDRLTVKFEADALDLPSPLPPPPSGQSLVQGILLAAPATLALDLGPRFGGFKATSAPVDQTTRLVIDIAAAQTESPPPPQQQPPPPPPELPPAFGQPLSPIRTIAVDPGHGGEDEGAKGPGGVKEKDLTLTIARRAKAAIEARLGVRVLLTRDDDRNVPINERTSLANNNKADLFVSLHANASMRATTTGAAIFCAEFDKEAAQAAAVEGAERLPTFGGGLREIDLVPWDVAQTRHLEQSATFAGLLLEQMRERIPLSARPMDRAPLRVLESANMPAVLVELGYLSNPEQEKLLTGDAFQRTFVQAFYDAVVKFRDALSTPPAGERR
jgi:N-acetylmuramoyl-L-alanine amidase